MPAFCAEAGADHADDAFDVERVEAARDRLLAAFDDLALVVHLPQAALGVALRPGHDVDVLDALAVARLDRESEPRHRSSLCPAMPPADVVGAASQCRGPARMQIPFRPVAT